MPGPADGRARQSPPGYRRKRGKSPRESGGLYNRIPSGPPGPANSTHWMNKVDDERWLRAAVALAAQCPPAATAFSVGAVIVADDRLLSQGFSRQTDPHDHAEEVALAAAGTELSAATVYSSLEPCGQRASRPRSCAELIIAAGIRRVVFAWREPDTFVPARGARLLTEAGVTVVQLPELADAAAAPNAHLL